MPFVAAVRVVGCVVALLLPAGILEAAESATMPPSSLVRDQVAIRVRLGLKDVEPSEWSGSVKASAGRILNLYTIAGRQGSLAQGNSWKAHTQRYQPKRGQDRDKMPVGDVAVVFRWAEATPDSRLQFSTKEGDFAVSLAELRLGEATNFLKGAVEVAQVANTQDLITTPDDEDFPAAVTAADGTVYVAYAAFTPGPHFAVRPAVKEEPKNFSMFAEAAGGDRVWLVTMKGSQWSPPVPVTDGGEDLYRTALAVDGQGRAWVFFSKNVGAGPDLTGGDWELFARSYANGKLGPLVRLTSEPGPDVYPAAATDAAGRVWVAWQAFRGDNSRVLALRQEGDAFGKPTLVADTPANEWSPAIAATASKPAEVTIAWDTYAKGDYDVYARTFRDDAPPAEPFPVAATLAYEARASLVYDGNRRLWAAWEQSGEKWGKNFGPVSPEAKMGIPLYQSRQLEVRVLDGGKWFQPAGDLSGIWPRKPGRGGKQPAKRAKASNDNRVSFARLGVDRGGRVWLSGRVWMAPPILMNQFWNEYVTYPTADGWALPILTAGGVMMLDKRPALVADPTGGLLLVGSGTGRQIPLEGPREKGAGKPKDQSPEATNHNLYAVPLVAPADAPPPRLNPISAPAVAVAPADAEPAQVRRMREYRTQWGNTSLRVVRGEFHRHTELSGDGGGDGALEDMWRYGLDAAAMDWLGCGDHDNGSREYPWWLTQKTSTIFQLAGAFSPMYTYERSVNYPDGHRNAMFAQRGVRPLPRLDGGAGKILDDVPIQQRPATPDTQMFYHYLLQFNGICASHTSATDMGTDWRDSHRQAEPIVEIYQGDRQNYECIDAPRAPTAEYALGGWRPQGFINLALQRGVQLGFECSSDHISTHISYCNVFVDQLTRDAILKGLKARHVYGSTDNIVADVRWSAGGEEHLMGDEFKATQAPVVRVHLEGTAPFAKISIIKDNRHVYTAGSKPAVVDFTWTDLEVKPGTSYYYVRGEQEDGELVWVSPVWIQYSGKSKTP